MLSDPVLHGLRNGVELARLPRTSSLFSYIFTVRVRRRTFVRLTLDITLLATRKLQRRDTQCILSLVGEIDSEKVMA